MRKKPKPFAFGYWARLNRAFDDAMTMQGGLGDPETSEERREDLRYLRDDVVRRLRATVPKKRKKK